MWENLEKIQKPNVAYLAIELSWSKTARPYWFWEKQGHKTNRATGRVPDKENSASLKNKDHKEDLCPREDINRET